MILDSIKNSDIYCVGNQGLKKGFEFIEEFIKNPKEPGKYEIDGDKVYAMVQEYQTKAPDKAEAHRKYIDIQYVAEGMELIKYENIEKLIPATEYDSEKDFLLYECRSDMTELILKKGDFAVFYPEDGHMPGLYVDKPEKVIKIVVKVKAL